jgi:putative drug exporter of the RND superfamily
MLERIARTSYKRRRLVLPAWLLVTAGLIALSGAAGGEFRTEFELPGSESQEAIDILNKGGFGGRTGDSGMIVFRAERGVEDSDVRSTMEDLWQRIDSDVDRVTVTSPYSEEGRAQVSRDGTIAFAELAFESMSQAEYTERAEQIQDLSRGSAASGLEIEYGGSMFASEGEAGASEGIGLLAAVVILLVAFGSLLAMGMPIVTALFGIAAGIAIITLLANVVTMPDFTTQAAAMIGIGVGIDYALFIVTRYRTGLAAGLDPESAVVTAMTTAGRAVLFAGMTVVIALLGMFFMGLELLSALAVSASAAVLMVMFASITLVPALLGFAGRNIDRFGLPHRASHRDPSQTMWHRWSRLVQRRPGPIALIGLAVLLALAAPILVMRLGFSDARSRPTTDTTRRAYDLVAEGFGPGFNGPLVIATDATGPVDEGVVERLGAAVGLTPGVAFSTPAISGDSGVAIIQAFPSTSPQSEATEDLIHHLRNEVVPGVVSGTGTEVRIGGVTAAGIDFADYNSERLPVFIGAVLALSFMLLVVVFRSPLVALKAVVMNLLSIGAAYGVIVAVFQWGWGASLIGVGRSGPVEAWVPMMLFAIVFGLSMDYEVFLLSRIREEYDATGDNAGAVAHGLATTARVISAAAAIMVAVFSSFVLLPELEIKVFGLGLAVAVFVDATIVRLLLVPATMEVLGDRNWWIPKWLDRVLPRVETESRLKSERVSVAS